MYNAIFGGGIDRRIGVEAGPAVLIFLILALLGYVYEHLMCLPLCQDEMQDMEGMEP